MRDLVRQDEVLRDSGDVSEARPDVARAGRIFIWAVVAALVTIMGGFAALKLSYNPPLGDGLDGSYYLQIARHVAQGEGLVTTFSTFHMGLDPLPQPATTYPLLPLLIGGIAWLIPLEQAAALVTEGAYVISIGLCFGFVLMAARRSLPRRSRWLAFGAASAASLLFGIDPVYHWASSRTYTESVSYVLLISVLWGYMLLRGARWRSELGRLAAWSTLGLGAGLCYLARFQLAVVPMCIVAVRLAASDRRRLRETAMVALGAAFPVSWMAVRALSLPNPSFRALYDYAAYRQLAELPPFDYVVHFDSRLDWVFDKVWALGMAFDLGDPNSYLEQFGVAAWIVPIAGLWLVVRIVTKRNPLRRWREPRHDALLLSAAVGALSVLPMHLVHAGHFREWNFAWRQGMPLFFILVPTGLWLLSQGRRWVIGALSITMAASIVSMARTTIAIPERLADPSFLEGYAAAGAYLERVGRGTGVLGIEPQPLAVFTDAPLHWLACWSDPAMAATLVARRPIDRVVLWPRQEKCRSLAAIKDRLVLEHRLEGTSPLLIFRVIRRTAEPPSETEEASIPVR